MQEWSVRQAVVPGQNSAQLLVRKRPDMMAVDARHVFRGHHGVNDGFLGGLHGRAKSGSIESFGTILRSTTWPTSLAAAFAVENAMKMSPEPLPAMLPVRP